MSLHLRVPALLALLAAAMLPAASAQTAASAYRSAFEGYKQHHDEPLKPWREANDTVGRIGGWRAYARETQESASAPARPASAPHGPHRGHPAR